MKTLELHYPMIQFLIKSDTVLGTINLFRKYLMPSPVRKVAWFQFCTGPQMITGPQIDPGPQMIPKLDRKWMIPDEDDKWSD